MGGADVTWKNVAKRGKTWQMDGCCASTKISDTVMYESTGLDRPEPTGPTDWNQTDWNWTDWNQTDRTGPTGPDQTGVTSAEQRLPIKDHGSRIKDHGSWIMDQGSWIMDQ